MQVWAIANQKGGVGKTTTAISLGALLAQRGYRCLLVDLDPHGSMTSYFGQDPDLVEDGVYRLFEREAGEARVPLVSLLVKGPLDGIHFLPASATLATLDRRFASRDGMGLVLKRALAGLGDHFDFAVLDCPPVFGLLMLNALAACTRLIIPVQTDYLARQGLERMMHTLRMVAHGGCRDIVPLIVPTMYDQRTRAARDGLQRLTESYAELLWPNVIPVDTKFRDASGQGLPLPVAHPNARGTAAYSALVGALV